MESLGVHYKTFQLLTAHDDTNMSMSYKTSKDCSMPIALPLSYTSQLSVVVADANSCRLSWKCQFPLKEDHTEQETTACVLGFYSDAAASLVKILEQHQQPFIFTHCREINHSASKTWPVIKDYDKLHTWLTSACSATESCTNGNVVGSERVLLIGPKENNHKVFETLTAFDESKFTFTYKFNRPAAMPIVFPETYVSTVTLIPVGENACIYSWQCTFPKLKEGTTMSEVLAFVTPFFAGGGDCLAAVMDAL